MDISQLVEYKWWCIGVVSIILLKVILKISNNSNKDPKPKPVNYSKTSSKNGSYVITLEESWKFLKNIAALVIKKFSKEDQQLLLQLGVKLLKLGVSYQHVIEYGVRSVTISEPSIQDKASQEKIKGGRS